MRRNLILCLLLLNLILALSPEQIKEAYERSYAYESVENYSMAIDALQPVLRVYPDGYTVNLRLGYIYYLNRNFANSLKHYEKAVQIYPESLEPRLGRLLPLLAQQKYREVEREAFSIINSDYYNYYGNLRLCVALREQNKNDTARKIALKMLHIYPIDVLFLTEYALTLWNLNEKEDALNLFWDILILEPENVTANYYLSPPEGS